MDSIRVEVGGDLMMRTVLGLVGVWRRRCWSSLCVVEKLSRAQPSPGRCLCVIKVTKKKRLFKFMRERGCVFVRRHV